MSSWANIAKKNTINKIDNNEILKSIIKEKSIIDNIESDIDLIKNKHISNVIEMYNILQEKVNNGYFTILTINTNNRLNQFINMIFNNFNMQYHLKHDNIYSDNDLQENVNSDEEIDFTPSYSKFAYI